MITQNRARVVVFELFLYIVFIITQNTSTIKRYLSKKDEVFEMVWIAALIRQTAQEVIFLEELICFFWGLIFFSSMKAFS